MSRLTSIGLSMAKSKYANIEIGSSEGLDAAVMEISVEAAEIETETLVLESVEHVVASLEAIAEEAQASIADGGLDRRAAGMMEVAVEAQLGRIGLSASDAVPSVESFGGTGTRVEATEVSVEAIGEKAKEVWAWLVKKFKELREKLLKWFKKVFSGAAMLKRRAEGVAKKATDKKGTKKDDAEDELSLGGAAKYLYKGNNGTVNIGDVAGGIEDYKTLADKIYRGHGSSLGSAADAVEAMLTGLRGISKEQFEGSDTSPFFSGGKLAGKDAPSFDVSGVDTSVDYLGGRSIEKKDVDGSAANMADLKSSLDEAGMKFEVLKGSDGKAVEVDSDQTFAPITPANAKSIAEDVVVIAEAIIAYESDYYKNQKKLEKMEKEAEKFGTTIAKYSLGAPGAAADKAARAAVSAVSRFNQSPSTNFTSAAVASCKAALDVCDKSLAQYD